ncbi:hypothetical protein [Burkholderia vietnamiensis]|uniref:hypothetical protein n=1 Tax=Burkholderia vietnamiensis TaxID=60552 RepID=UPI001CF1C1DF|nr:hypothetical protein [Burkholderia vietnamiensis]MCA8448884.1 hypothetical protein [Burkholderia vietnamiensis]
MTFDHNALDVTPEDTSGFNPFAQHDPADIAAAVLRVNHACKPWGHDTSNIGVARQRERSILRRTKRTRYIVLGHSPNSGPDRHLYVTLLEAIAIVGGENLLQGAVANGHVPIVVAAGADVAFRRADVTMLRTMFGPPLVRIEQASD